MDQIREGSFSPKPNIVEAFNKAVKKSRIKTFEKLAERKLSKRYSEKLGHKNEVREELRKLAATNRFPSEAHARSNVAAKLKLERFARIDKTTGLANETGIKTEIERRMAEEKPFMVGVVDINKFKEFNDKYGHLKGNEIIRTVAGALRSSVRSVREEDKVGHPHGDEYYLVLDGNKTAVPTMVLNRFNEILSKFGPPYNEISISPGVAVYNPEEKTTAEKLIHSADMAMYDAKVIKSKLPIIHYPPIGLK